MGNNTVKYETGATSHAVNDLILFTDNTRELAECRDNIYAAFANNNSAPQHFDFSTLIRMAKAYYYNEFTKANSKHIESMSYEEIKEYCQLYADDFNNWKSEHGYK